MSDLTIDPMTERHLPAVLRIERRLFPTPWTEAMFRQEVDDDHLSRSFVARAGRRVIGYMVSWFVHDEVHLLNIGIDKEFKRRGYARELIQHLIERATAEKREIVTLEVRTTNVAARRLYESFGFEVAGMRKRYYDTGEDALVMTLHMVADEGESS